jgi:hypothetical protein
VANYLGIELGKIKIKRFADGEVYVQVQESIRGCDVFLLQPTSPPVNDSLMELLVTIDACRRASARSITAGGARRSSTSSPACLLLNTPEYSCHEHAAKAAPVLQQEAT